MIILSTLSLLISNAVSLRRDMSILYNRIAIIALLYAILQSLISFSIISKGGIGIHGIDLHVTNISQVFLAFYLILLFLNNICILWYTDISMSTPAGASLIFGIFFWIIEITRKFYIKNKDFFVVKNYCFIKLDKSKLCLVLYMLIYITIVFLPIFYLNSSFSFMIDFFYLNKIQWWALFLSIFLVFIGFLLNGVNFMFNMIYEYINILINIIIIFSVIFMNLYLIFDIHLSEVIYSLLCFKYFRYILFITINLYFIYTWNIKGLFNVLLIFTIGYIIYNFCFFTGALYFINFFYFFPVNSLAIPESLSLRSSEASSEDVNNYNLLDDLHNKAVNIMLENKLYSSTEYINSPFVCKFVSIFSILFGIANKTAIYIPSAFQCNTMPEIMNVNSYFIGDSPIITKVIRLAIANLKLFGSVFTEGGESSSHEPSSSNYSNDSIGSELIQKNWDKIPSSIYEEIKKDSGLCSVILLNKQKSVLDYLLSTSVEKSTNLFCFQKNPNDDSIFYIYNHNDIHYNNVDKISVYTKLGDYPDINTMYEDANRSIHNIRDGLEEVDPNLHWIGGKVRNLGLVGEYGYNEYSAYIFIKHESTFSTENLIDSCKGNFFLGRSYERNNQVRVNFNIQNSSYDPTNPYHCDKIIGIYDHVTSGKKKMYKLPFNSPPRQAFNSKIMMYNIENTYLNKEIFFYYGGYF